MKALIPTELIEKKILLVQGEKVILDKDLAVLYGVTTSNLNKAVNRNIERFPDDFMIQLTAEELGNLKFHFGTSSWGGTRKPLRAFTEQGVAMLSSVLRSKPGGRGEHYDHEGFCEAPDDDIHAYNGLGYAGRKGGVAK